MRLRIGRGQALAVALGAATLTLAVAAPVLRSHWLLNQAQLARLRGIDARDYYASALAANDGDGHVRWQVGEAALRRRDYAMAAEVLSPLRRNGVTRPQAMAALLEALVYANDGSGARLLFDDFGQDLALEPHTAARLWRDGPGEIQCVTEVVDCHFLSTAIGHAQDAPEFRWLIETVRHPGQRSHDLMNALHRYMEWRSQPPTAPIVTTRTWRPHAFVVSALGLAAGDVSLGPELIENGEFAVTPGRPVPDGWLRSHMSSGDPWNHGLYALNVDAGSARVDGMGFEEDAELQPARAGYWHSRPIDIPAGAAYVFSFRYRTSRDASDAREQPAYWLSDGAFALAGDQHLPPTADKWKRVVVIGANRGDAAVAIQPLLRLFGAGTAWFDDVSLRLFDGDSAPELDTPFIATLGEDA